MVKFIARRILFFIPVLLVLVLLAFALSTLSPQNPLDKILLSEKSAMEGSSGINELQKQYWIKKLGLDLPLFYLSLKPLSYASAKFPLYDKTETEKISSLISQTGNALLVQKYLSTVKELKKSARESGDLQLYQKANRLSNTTDFGLIERTLSELTANTTANSTKHITNAKNAFSELQSNKTVWKNYVPVIGWHSQNRFNQWLFGNNERDEFKSNGIVRGDFGVSFVTREPVLNIVKSKLKWTVFFTICSVALAFLISVPLGIWCHLHEDTLLQKWLSRVLVSFISLPVFVVAIALIYAFANPDFINVLPSSGIKPIIGFEKNNSIIERMVTTAPYLILPMFCYTYSTLAFLTMLTKKLVDSEVKLQYMLTSRAKGLGIKLSVYKHALRNSLLPLLTMLGSVFPALLAGSVVLETIFTIPGMGYQTWYAIQNQDYPYVTCIVLLTGIFTVIGFLITDILYSIADPRISLTETN